MAEKMRYKTCKFIVILTLIVLGPYSDLKFSCSNSNLASHCKSHFPTNLIESKEYSYSISSSSISSSLKEIRNEKDPGGGSTNTKENKEIKYSRFFYFLAYAKENIEKKILKYTDRVHISRHFFLV